MIEWIFLSMVVLISSIISYDDWKRNIIKNKFLLILILATVMYNFYLFIFQHEVFLSTYFWSLIGSLVIGFFLWEFGFWPAGDSKMFIVLSFVLFSFLPPAENIVLLDFLVNSFVPLFLFSFFHVLFKSSKRDLTNAMKSSFNLHRILTIALIFIGLAWFLSLPFSIIGFQQNLLISLAILFLIMEALERYFPFKLEVAFVLLAIARIIIDYKNVLTLNFLFENVLIIFVFVFFRFFILELSFKTNTYSVKISKLKIGMRPAEGIMKTKERGKIKYIKMKLIQFSEYDILKHRSKKFIHSISDEGLTENDIKLLNNLASKNKLESNSLLIHVTIPFAIFILAGFVFTAIFNTSFLSYIIMLIAQLSRI